MKSIITLFLALTCILLISSCSKSPAPTNGSFTFDGTTYSGTCVGISGSPGINIKISATTGAFIIYNMPTQSSGDYSFDDAYVNSNGVASVYGFTASPLASYGTHAFGTITKTGSRSFTFTTKVYNYSTGTTYSVTGSGSY